MAADSIEQIIHGGEPTAPAGGSRWVGRIRQALGCFRQLRTGAATEHEGLRSQELSMTTLSLITGASRGLGRNAALHIAHRGGDVIVTYQHQADAAEALVAEIRALGRQAVALQLDVGQVASFPAFPERLHAALRDTWARNRFDHLVNNAGHGEYALVAQTTEAQFDGLVNVHFKGVFFLTQALLPLIEDGGRIVNLSSGLTRMALPGYGAYAAMKGAVEVLSVYLAKELGARGITVNTVAPGAIETDFGGGVVRDNPDVNQLLAGMTALAASACPTTSAS
jgi:NAD(P)-dependent dehydrogenase (short-subunit alcohol dehydrogenase family)